MAENNNNNNNQNQSSYVKIIFLLFSFEFIIIIMFLFFLIIGEHSIELIDELMGFIDDTSEAQQQQQLPQSQQLLGGSNPAPPRPRTAMRIEVSRPPPPSRNVLSLNNSNLAMAAATREYQSPNLLTGDNTSLLAPPNSNENIENKENSGDLANRSRHHHSHRHSHHSRSPRGKIYDLISNMDSIEEVMNSNLDFEKITSRDYSNDSDDYKLLEKKLKNSTKKSILKWNDCNVDKYYQKSKKIQNILAISGNNLLYYTSKILKSRQYTLKKAIILQFDDIDEGKKRYQTLWQQIQKFNNDYDNDNNILDVYKQDYPILCDVYIKMRKHEKEVMLYLYMYILVDYDPNYNQKFLILQSKILILRSKNLDFIFFLFIESTKAKEEEKR